MASRWSDHDLPLRRSVRPVRSPWANLNVNSGRQLLDKWVVGVDESPAAWCKTSSSAPYLLNRAKLIWVSWGTVCLALSRSHPSASAVLVQGHSDETHGCWCAQRRADLWAGVSSVKALGESLLLAREGLHPNVCLVLACQPLFALLSIQVLWPSYIC